jgi:hypothetical protein
MSISGACHADDSAANNSVAYNIPVLALRLSTL